MDCSTPICHYVFGVMSDESTFYAFWHNMRSEGRHIWRYMQQRVERERGKIDGGINAMINPLLHMTPNDAHLLDA